MVKIRRTTEDFPNVSDRQKKRKGTGLATQVNRNLIPETRLSIGEIPMESEINYADVGAKLTGGMGIMELVNALMGYNCRSPRDSSLPESPAQPNLSLIWSAAC